MTRNFQLISKRIRSRKGRKRKKVKRHPRLLAQRIRNKSVCTLIKAIVPKVRHARLVMTFSLKAQKYVFIAM